jgi:excisionase family DNA binding protein
MVPVMSLTESDLSALVRSAVCHTLANVAKTAHAPQIAYTIPQAAAAIGLPANTLRDRVASGEIPARKRAGKWLILHSDLMAWLSDS